MVDYTLLWSYEIQLVDAEDAFRIQFSLFIMSLFLFYFIFRWGFGFLIAQLICYEAKRSRDAKE